MLLVFPVNPRKLLSERYSFQGCTSGSWGRGWATRPPAQTQARPCFPQMSHCHHVSAKKSTHRFATWPDCTPAFHLLILAAFPCLFLCIRSATSFGLNRVAFVVGVLQGPVELSPLSPEPGASRVSLMWVVCPLLILLILDCCWHIKGGVYPQADWL